MRRFSKIIIILIGVTAICGCSRKKDTFLNRNWHAVTTEYNTLFNGNFALEQGKEQINSGYNDNFWALLPVERMQVSQDILLPSENRNEFFQIAEEKATKAIQRHSMQIGGKEKNPQIDEAYLLLGKARYYDQRFIPALEAFNYILHKYPTSNTINYAQIWREKTNIRLDNNELAIKNLKRILDTESLNNQDRAEANATLSQAYINLGAVDSALIPIKNAAYFTNNNDEKGRYLYLQGQLYNALNKPDSANYAFDEVIALNRKTPRVYMLNAHMQKAENFDFSTKDHTLLLSHLKELEEDRENRPFLDRIYFQLAEYYQHVDSIDVAISYYNKSLRATQNDVILQSLDYETLANISFDRANYRQASAYYDSTLTNIPTNTRDYRIINRKRENLGDVIFYEQIADVNDSILKLVNMPEVERLTYFTNYSNTLKEEAKSRALLGETEMISPVVNTPVRNIPSGPGAPGAGNQFYFYNPSRTNNGLQQFLRVWGPRELADNWRTNSSRGNNVQGDELDAISATILDNDPRFNPQTYIAQIPSNPDIIDSLSTQRDYAYYQLGLIYKEKFGELDLAASRLEDVLEFTTEERLVVPAKYYLFQIYSERNQQVQASTIKNDILENHPNSRYAEIIKNPGVILAVENDPEKRYQELYALFENQQYQETIQRSEQYIEQFGNDEILPKMELLKAMAVGRLEGFQAYKESLNYVALTYPQTTEGKKAQQLFNNALPQISNQNFVVDSLAGNIKIIYSFQNSEVEKANGLKTKIDKALQELGYTQLTTSIDLYNREKQFVVVHNLENLERALGLAELLSVNKDYKIQYDYTPISSENYRIIQIHKNLDTYITQTKNE